MQTESMDPYVYPGTTVLRNRRDIRDRETLSRFEMDMTTRRIAQLLRKSRPLGKFDIAHLKQIHHHIFQDVYDWAGELRTVNISRPGQFYFAFTHMIVPSLDAALTKLANERLLVGLGVAQFSQRAAYYMGELNAVHPFRDGNGRTQREFIRQLASLNEHQIHWSRVTRDAMGEASKRSFQAGDCSALAALIQSAIIETQ